MAFAGPFNRIGPQGPKGKDGRDGIDGKDGKNGRDGKNGKDGKDGVTTVVYSGHFASGGETVAPSVSSSSIFYTGFSCGKLTNLDEDDFNLIDCCELPIVTERQVLDLGELEFLCQVA